MSCKYLLMKNPFATKSYAFALNVIEVCRCVMTDRKEYIMSKQLTRSGTAVGALYREAQHAESRADFIHKLAIAQKECNESIYWIDLLRDSHSIDETTYCQLRRDGDELMRMLTTMIKTAKANLNRG